MQQKANQKKPSAHGAQTERKKYVPPRMQVIPLGPQQMLATSGAAACMMPDKYGSDGGFFFQSQDLAPRLYDRWPAICENPQVLIDEGILSNQELDVPQSYNPDDITLRELITQGTPRPDVECEHSYESTNGEVSIGMRMAFCYNDRKYRLSISHYSW